MCKKGDLDFDSFVYRTVCVWIPVRTGISRVVSRHTLLKRKEFNWIHDHTAQAGIQVKMVIRFFFVTKQFKNVKTYQKNYVSKF